MHPSVICVSQVETAEKKLAQENASLQLQISKVTQQLRSSSKKCSELHEQKQELQKDVNNILRSQSSMLAKSSSTAAQMCQVSEFLVAELCCAGTAQTLLR